MAKTILIIDDEPDILIMVEARLKKAGYNILKAVNGLEGIDMIMSAKPDLILLDLAMPGIDGYEVCRRSKKDESTKDIPVILFTASVVTASAEEKVKELKADGFIVKPFDHKELLEKIKSIIG